jgi:hypothetical protein
MSGIRLDMSIGADNFDAMGATYRDEGLSVGNDHMVSFSCKMHFIWFMVQFQ